MVTAFRLISLPLLLAAAASTQPAERPLARDDAFYVSAWLRYISPQSNKSVTIDVREPPCYEPFVFQDRVEGEDLFTAKDPRGVLHGFADGWSDRIHRTQEECVQKAKEGVPKVEKVDGPEETSGRTYKIIRAEE